MYSIFSFILRPLKIVLQNFWDNVGTLAIENPFKIK